MKKVILAVVALLVAAVMVFAFAGCKKSGDDTKESDTAGANTPVVVEDNTNGVDAGAEETASAEA